MREGNTGEMNQEPRRQSQWRENHKGKEVKCLKREGKVKYKIKQEVNDKTRHE